VYGISELATAEVYCGVSLSTVRLCVPNMCLISSKDVLYTCTQCETKQLSKESRARARARRNGQRERSHTVNGHTATGHTRTRLRVKHRPRVVLSPRAECVAWNARKRPRPAPSVRVAPIEHWALHCLVAEIIYSTRSSCAWPLASKLEARVRGSFLIIRVRGSFRRCHGGTCIQQLSVRLVRPSVHPSRQCVASLQNPLVWSIAPPRVATLPPKTACPRQRAQYSAPKTARPRQRPLVSRPSRLKYSRLDPRCSERCKLPPPPSDALQAPHTPFVER
jgi:hypothetical protein